MLERIPELRPHPLATGYREIDADTEGLCFLMERIFEPLVECRRCYGSCDHRQCTRIGAIMKYMTRSFSRQDKLMVQAGYPEDEEHRRDHAALIEQLTAMQAARLCADRDSQVVRDAVRRWSLSHNRQCDRPLGDWAAKLRLRPPAP